MDATKGSKGSTGLPLNRIVVAVRDTEVARARYEELGAAFEELPDAGDGCRTCISSDLGVELIEMVQPELAPPHALDWWQALGDAEEAVVAIYFRVSDAAAAAADLRARGHGAVTELAFEDLEPFAVADIREVLLPAGKRPQLGVVEYRLTARVPVPEEG